MVPGRAWVQNLSASFYAGATPARRNVQEKHDKHSQITSHFPNSRVSQTTSNFSSSSFEQTHFHFGGEDAERRWLDWKSENVLA